MEPFKILYIEHSPDREAMKQAMKKEVPAEVVVVSSPESVQEQITESHFDLVITDAYFLPEGKDHYGEEGEYRLREIVNAIRSIENNRIRIAVLTRIAPNLFHASHFEDLKGVDYLWHKSKMNQDLLCWNISRIKDDLYKKFPEHALVDRLLELLDSGRHEGDVWKAEMKTMLTKYKTRRGEMEQIEGAYTHIINITDTLGIKPEFGKLFKNFKKAETFNIAGKPSAWGHLRHALNVFWLGYYMLNVGLFDVIKIAKTIFPSQSDFSNKEEVVTKVNTAWFLAALLHDVGLLGARVGELVERYNELLGIYPYWDLKLQDPTHTNTFPTTILETLKTDLFPFFDKELQNNITAIVTQMENGIDHGILSALTIFNTFKKSSISKDTSIAASISVLLHNLFCPNIKGQLTKIDFSEYPLACLLLICDQIEVWDRQTGQESRFSEIPMECIALSRFDYNIRERSLEGVINYIPFRDILPDSVKMEETGRKLQDILDKTLMILSAIEFSDENGKINITFKLDGRQSVGSWKPTLSASF